MKMFLISSDKDVLTGMRLAGVDGRLISNKDEFSLAIKDVLKDTNIGILLITNALGEEYAEEVLELKKTTNLIITQVPDPGSPETSGSSITRYVQDAIGIKV